MLTLVFILMFCGLLPLTQCRRHKYNLVNDDRRQFTLSTFGFLKKGTLNVNMSRFSFKNNGQGLLSDKVVMFGFTLDKSGNSGVSQYLEGIRSNCSLFDEKDSEDKGISTVFIKIDTRKKKLTFERKGKTIKHLMISNDSRTDKLTRRDTSTFGDKLTKVLSDASLLSPRRHLLSETQNTTENETTVPVTVPSTTVASSNDVTHEFPLKEIEKGVYSANFLVTVTRNEEEGLYNLIFHNCWNYIKNREIVVNLTLEITEDNNGNFLSAGEIPEPAMFFAFSIAFFIASMVWIIVLKKSDVYKIHYLMFAVIFVKSISSMFHGVNSSFIQHNGVQEEAWAILYYIVYLIRVALMFITIILIGAGWAFIKHMLSDKEKKLFLIVIPLQILDQIAWLILEESEEGQMSYSTWKEIFILVDLLCCGAILFPVVWSIRHLQEASATDGKAAINLNKLKLFRQFYILVVSFIYFTRIVVYLLKIALPFRYEWLTEMSRELAVLVFFLVTGYKFRPASDNPYLQVPQESDDEIEMEEVLTKTGSTESVVKVNQRNSESTENLMKQRESSHEYD
ncbi:protein GPR107-like isoform X2 [Gigantopelta aegis]|uniref:protein GPR107-like isoform X2 n=1 Tax=Gigantopelta aegis TaxID=1735272 RepID=UPI001B889530|nr:protein GPR107-like isoform X2 [Gigantopelta aegis]